jgi:predicted flavoprotein YhiN
MSPFQPANCGWEIPWPAELLAEAEGKPLKNIVARAGDLEAAGELLVTRHGLEGGAIYQLGPALRGMPLLFIDLKPGVSPEQLVRKLGLIKRDFLPEARTRWKLGDAAFALLRHFAPAPESAESLAASVKNLLVPLRGPRPLDEAISSAGGVRWEDLDERLMLKKFPGVFCAGEMIDWEAPTGGYLMQACFATGTEAGRSALAWTRGHQARAGRDAQERHAHQPERQREIRRLRDEANDGRAGQ